MDTGEFFHRVDPKFKHTLRNFYSGETLKFCYQCGTCTASCPISHLLDSYRPNKILELTKLGIRNTPFSNAVLLCSACTSCTKGCPQGVRVHEVINALKSIATEDGHAREYLLDGFEKTLAALSEEMPFPVTYGWICLRPSEQADQGTFDSLVKDVLRRSFLSHQGERPIPDTDNGVAIIGSGPAGLTAAWELAKAGLKATVFESLSEAGGMFKTGIPEYRLPKEIVDAEIEQIKSLGVEIKTNAPVDFAAFENLLQDYKAVYIATGAPVNRQIRIEGEDLDGVVPVLDFLREYNLTGHAKVGKSVVVIGGGNVAVDAARTALHCGAETVRLFCLESRSEMPSHEWEAEEAATEGVQLNPSWGPKRIIGIGQKVTAVEFVRCKSVFDEHKKFSPEFDEKITHTIEADTVIPAIGQSTDLGFLGNHVVLMRGAISVDPLTMETSLPGVFAGGDAVSGTASAIEAIIAGKTAAKSILRLFQNAESDNAASD